jgi:tetratricopeptide (TPR) repeat protein
LAVEDVLARARVLADLDRYDEAEPLLAQALAADPDNEDGLALFSRVLVTRHRFQEADTVVERLLRAHPDSLRGLMLMARIKCMLDQDPEGLPFARRAVELDPDNVTALETLADVLQQVTHGSAEALDVLRRALELDPESAYAHRLTGEIHLDLAQYAEAESWLLRALAITPQDPFAVVQLGLARAGLGRFDESREQVAAALRLDATPGMIAEVVEYIEVRAVPEHLTEIYRMALAALGRPDLSQPGAAGSNPELLAAQGKLAWRMLSRDADDAGHRRAGKLAASVLAALPGNADARYVWARELCEQGRYTEALPLAEQLHEQGYRDAHLALTVAYSGTANYEGVLALTQQQLAINPDSVMHLRALAHALRNLKRYDEALAAAQRAAELSPSAPEVQLQLGLSAREVGDLELAERALRAAIKDAPDEGYPAAELALLLAADGRWPEAEAVLAPLSLDLPDASRLLHPCLGIAQLVLTGFGPRIGEILEDNQPTPDGLAECAHWLGLMVRMFTLGLPGHPETAASSLATMPQLLGYLQEVPAPADSGYAGVVRDLASLLAAHGLIPGDE